MRKTLPLLIIAAVTVVTVVAGADARRKATSGEKRKIARVFNAPPKCAKVYISTVDGRWASYEFNPRRYDVSPCEQVAADGKAFLERSRGHWRVVTAGSAFDCPDPSVPRKVARDLRMPCG